MRTFATDLFALAKRNPLWFLLFIVVVVLFLGGVVWTGLRFLFGLVRKVPGGSTVVNTVEKASAATGS